MQPQTASWMNKFSAINPHEGLTPEQQDRVRAACAARKAAKQNQSTGPTTEEGKRIASMNARKHGFAGAVMVIDDEDKEAYDAHLESYRQSLLPANQIEADTVRLAANAMWRVDRLTSIETGLIELEMAHNTPHADAMLDQLDIYHYMAIAFMQNTNDTTAIELCRRYLSSAQRDFQRAIDTFYKLRENRVEPAAAAPVKSPRIHLIPGPPNELPSGAAVAIPHATGSRKTTRAERKKLRK